MDRSVVHRISCGMFLRRGQVLLVHRSASKEAYPNVWDFPGGHLEFGETYVDALTREMREELNVDIRPPQGQALLTIRNVGLVLKVWGVDTWEGEISNAAPDEHDDMGWFAPDEAKLLDLANARYLELFGRVV